MARAMARPMKAHRVKLGTVPAMLQFRHAYNFREGLRVTYREVGFTARSRFLQPAGPWQTGIVRRLEPMLFIDRF